MKNFCKIVMTVAQIAVPICLMAACAPDSRQTNDLDNGLGAFSEVASTDKILVPTIYFIKLMSLHQQKCEIKKTIYDVAGQPLLQLCPNLYKTCVIEGTCAILDADDLNASEEWEHSNSLHDINLINYVKLKNGVPLFQKVDTARCPFGYGVKGMCLDPFYTLAADLNFHKPGDVIFIPKIAGVVLPRGERHSGYFIVRDKGGAIKGAHRFDFFTGFMDYRHPENPFTKFGLNDKKTKVEYRIVTGSEADSFRKKRNYPLTPLSHKTTL